MPLAQAREADTHAEDFTAEPAAVTFSPAADVDGLWAETRDAQSRTSDPLSVWRRISARLSRYATKDRRPSRLGGKARVLVPNYRLAPEHPFPAALDDAVQAYEWLLAHGAEPSKTVVAGDSAGGGLAVSTAIVVRDRGLPMPAGIVALSPWADLTCSGDSMTSCAATDIECTSAGLLEMASSYLGGGDPRQPLASPVFADLTGLPSILCLVGGDEALLDDTVRLVRSAGIAGVDATAVIVAGMQHIFPIWAGAFPEADAAVALIGDWVQARTVWPIHLSKLVAPDTFRC